MKTIQIDDVPIVLCHGLFGSLSDPLLVDAFGSQTVFAPDMLGYGNNRLDMPEGFSLVDQADHVLAFMDQHSIQQANVVGHSVGGAVAALIAIRHPDRVRCLISVEGNMTPPDSFWSADLATQSIVDIQQLVDGYRADVVAWISSAGVNASTQSIRIATDWLDRQPASTIRAQASAVVKATSEESGFIEQLRYQLVNGLELHTIAGEKSRQDWHIPEDIEAAAKSVTVISGVGHLMMLESPSGFANAILHSCGIS